MSNSAFSNPALSVPLTVANGGTNSATASDARTALGLAIGTNVQAYNANLTTFAGIAPSANVQTLLGAADYAAFRTSLSLVIGTNVQAYNANLTTFAGIAPSANVQTLLGAANYAAFKTSLSLNNVENTALTTWAGATTITTLGTIVTGVWNGTTVAVANGGTGQTTYTDGQLLIGNTTGNTLAKATLTGTANQVVVTNGSGTITLATPQNIHTAASPTFAGLNDTNGNELIIFTTTASAVNELTITNAATTTFPTVTASGGDSNVGMTLLSKGTGVIAVKSATNSTDAFSILKSDGNRILRSDTSNTRIAIGGNTAPTSTLMVIGPISTAFSAKTTTTTVAAVDSVLTGDTTSAAFTMTLPTAVSITGRQYNIKRINSGANNLTVGTTSSQTIDGSTTKVLGAQWSSITVVSDGSNWLIVSQVGTVT
jgi:hypothetical protein